MKNIPLGIENFEEAMRLFYVDKTLILKDVIDSCLGKTLLVARPRGFGKSLTLSMIESFFSSAKDTYHLFQGLNILKEDEKHREYLNAYPVIRLNMKDVSAPGLAPMLDQAYERIAALFRLFPNLAKDERLFDYEKEKFLRFANKKETDPYSYANSLSFLCELIHKTTGKKVVMLIDEYDTPLENAFQKGFYDEAIEFFKRLYSSTLKANDHLLFAFVTGVLQIAKESIFSELNNLNVYNFLESDFLPYFGFTKDEVKTIFAHFQVAYDEAEIARYYGGYGHPGMDMYNPWSILAAVEKEKVGQYWINTGSNATVSEIIAGTPSALKELNALLTGERKRFPYRPSISYVEIANDIPSLFSYLVQCGYLTSSPPDEEGYSELSIPNEEIRLAFENEIIGRSSKSSSLALAKKFKIALLNGDKESISRYLEECILDSFSYFDLNEEKSYQIMLISLLAVLFDEYLVESEANNRFGRCDILLLPKVKTNPGLVIEIKFLKGRLGEKRVAAKAEEGLNQIKKNAKLIESL